MSKEIEVVAEGKHVIVMKNGMTHLVGKNTALTIANHIKNQESHSFIGIRELGDITINSAEISGVYTPHQYYELTRINAGEYKCSFDSWHKKREACTCALERAKTREEHMRRIEHAREYAPLTPEQKKEAAANAARVGQELRKLGVLKRVSGKAVLFRSKLNEYEQKFGTPYKVPKGYEIVEDVPV